MEVIFAVLADSANVSKEGKLNILGNFSHISATEFPARHPEMQLVLRMEAQPAEFGKTKTIEMSLLGEDGEKLSGFSAEFEVPKPEGSGGQPVNMQSIIKIVDTIFPRAGRYVVNVLIGGETKAQVRLSVGEPGG